MLKHTLQTHTSLKWSQGKKPKKIGRLKQAKRKSKAQKHNLEQISTLKETKRAMLNIMEDLEIAKNMLALEKAKDEAMLASIGEGLIAVDTDRKVIMMNKVAECVLGWPIKDLMGSVLTEIPLVDDAGNLIPLDKRPTTIALATGELTKVNYYIVKKDKTKLPISITATPIKLENKTIGLIEIIRDVSRELEIDRAKSEFVSLASHQLRTPLGIIKWYLEALENDECYKNASAEIRKYIEEISTSNERVLSLVRNLLSVSRIDQGNVKDEPQSVDVTSVVKEVIDQMQIVALKKHIAIHCKFPEHSLPTINIDVLRFHEVIENLINNAIGYTAPYGTVDVFVDKVDTNLLISIKDTGIGLSNYDMQHLFTKFYRGEHAIGYNPEGTGLGLYVAKSYVEGWGGKILVESIETKGATFTITLPILKQEKL